MSAEQITTIQNPNLQAGSSLSLRLLIASSCLGLMLGGSSCVVGKKKYEALLKDRNTLDSTLTDLKGKHQDLNNKHTDLGKRLAAEQQRAGQLVRDTATLGANGRTLRGQLAKADQDYNQLMNANLKQTQDLNRKNSALASNLAAREARVKELEDRIAEKERATKALRDKVAQSLLGFNEKDLTVKVKNGKVYVSLSEQLLFESGRYNVDPKGASALKTLAEVLKKDTTVSVTIEGHTDDVPIRSGTAGMKDNWDLSVLRATSIARLLSEEGVTGAKLIASGRSQYLPLNPARNTEARTQNRRTEIILTPKLDELFKILGD